LDLYADRQHGKRMGVNGRTFATAHFSRDGILAGFERELNDLVAGIADR
jgi:hypothetical protein